MGALLGVVAKYCAARSWSVLTRAALPAALTAAVTVAVIVAAPEFLEEHGDRSFLLVVFALAVLSAAVSSVRLLCRAAYGVSNDGADFISIRESDVMVGGPFRLRIQAEDVISVNAYQLPGSIFTNELEISTARETVRFCTDFADASSGTIVANIRERLSHSSNGANLNRRSA